MGCVSYITAEKYPAQSDWVGKEVEVCFHYDTSKIFKGVIIRDDVSDEIESPYTIIILEDGRVVLSTECQYTLPMKG